MGDCSRSKEKLLPDLQRIEALREEHKLERQERARQFFRAAKELDLAGVWGQRQKTGLCVQY